MPNLSRVLLITLTIPAIGIAVGFFLVEDVNQSFRSAGFADAGAACSGALRAQLGNDAREAALSLCQLREHAVLLAIGSAAAAALGALIPIAYWLSSWLAGTNRKLIALLFPVLLPVSLVFLSFLASYTHR